jgi:glycosyltransferase involved in cell wall biosynthesis
VHWETNIYGSTYVALSLVRGANRFLGLWKARWYGARIVWTMHNTHAHEYPHPRIDAWGRTIMWRLAHAVIIQNRTAIPKYKEQHPGKRVVYIPHGNYIGVYGPRADAARAAERARRGFLDTDIVLLGIGMIRPYKRYEDTIDAVLAAEKKGVPVRLVIAGKGDAAYIASLRARAVGSKAVSFEEGRIADTDVPKTLAMADYAVFAYGESSLTSGALLWALSYGLPCIVGEMPAAELVHDGINGYCVPPPPKVKPSESVGNLMLLVESLPKRERIDRDRVVATVAEYGWDRVARETVALYAGLT